jgi:hypothetical protein
MSSMVVNCFNFTLGATCHMDSGIKIEIYRTSAEEIVRVVQATGTQAITLIGPRDFIEKIRLDILKLIDIEVFTIGGTNDVSTEGN